jgi:predicted ATPase
VARGLTRFVGREAEFLYETRLFPEHEYTFKHALTHEVAYGSLLQERRRALHARIVEVLEALYVDRQAEQVERLAHHGLRGEVWDKAMAYCRQAEEKAMARSAHREAVGYFEQALSAVPHLPETRNTREQAIAAAQRALALAREHQERGHQAYALRLLGKIEAQCDPTEHQQAAAHYRRALTLAEELGMRPLVAHCQLGLGMLYRQMGQVEEARAVHRDRAIPWHGGDDILAPRGRGGPGAGDMIS